MITLYNYEGKTEEEVKEKCLKELSVNEDEVFTRYKEIEGSLFKAKKIQLTALKKEDIVSYIKEYIENIKTFMSIDIKVEIREKEDNFNVQLISENNSILIGKDGRTLSSIQLLLKQAISTQSGFNIRVNVDVSNYKSKKIDQLEREVKRIIREVLSTKVDVELDPMTAYERRCIHCLVSEYEELSSESFGEGPDRHIVIRYNGK